MSGTVIVAVALVAAIGLLARHYFNMRFDRVRSVVYHISWREYVVGVVVFGLGAGWAIVAIGNNLSVNSTLRYQEFYNGVEVDVERSTTQCYAGRAGNSASSGQSNCDHVHRTGSYTYWDTCPETRPTVDSEGNVTTETVWVDCPKTANIYTPYATLEAKYWITDSIGGEYRFPLTYVPDEAKQFDANEPIPASVPRGAPEEWLESLALKQAGTPRSVTGIFTYDNLILAAQEDLLLPYSEDVERYLEEELLPDHTLNINDDPMSGFNGAFASKVSFVGVTVSDETAWQESQMDFNAALGSKLRGDMHTVFIDSNLVDSPERYTNALKAYWSDTEYFGRRAIAKNAIIVVIGVDGNSVEWARATTGMPFGNEDMARFIQDFLPGAELTPDAIFGNPSTVVIHATSEDADDEVIVTLSEPRGVLEEIIFETKPFARACMECEGDDDAGQLGYGHLVAKIRPPFWQQALMVAVVGVVSVGWWTLVARQTLFESRSADVSFSRTPRPVRKYSEYRRRRRYPF